MAITTKMSKKDATQHPMDFAMQTNRSHDKGRDRIPDQLSNPPRREKVMGTKVLSKQN